MRRNHEHEIQHRQKRKISLIAKLTVVFLLIGAAVGCVQYLLYQWKRDQEIIDLELNREGEIV